MAFLVDMLLHAIYLTHRHQFDDVTAEFCTTNENHHLDDLDLMI